jgi:hypothetical protein
MSRKRREDIAFIVKLDDGSEHRMTIDPYTLKSGDHVARIVVGEQQRAGRIPKGQIVNVRRARYNE